MNKSKTKIVIASVLKPVDDVRNYEKIAASLAEQENYVVTILGTASKGNPQDSKISTHAWKKFQRLSWQRIKVQKSYWKILKEIKPDLIIFTTFELLLISVLFRWRFGCKLVYDIQEDYLKNLLYQRFYPLGIRHVVGLSIRGLELLLSPFVSGYLLAEKTYQKDIFFVRKKSLILVNKSLPISSNKHSAKFRVIFTGTISTYSRTLESLELYLQIKEELPDSIMIVIGYVPSNSYRKLLESRYERLTEIELKLSSDPVPHTAIVKQISSANLAIIGYAPNPVNENKIPTKLYEYTAAQLPYLVQSETHWAQVGGRLGGAIPIDFSQPDSLHLRIKIERVEKLGFAESGFYWQEQHKSLCQFISNIID